MADFLTELMAEGERNRQLRINEGVDPNDIAANLAWSTGNYQAPARLSSGTSTQWGNAQTVAVDPFTGSPIVAGQDGNMPATSAALGGIRGNAAAGASVGGSAPYMSPIPGPAGYTVADKDQTRLLPQGALAIDGVLPENSAVAAIGQAVRPNMRGDNRDPRLALMLSQGADPGMGSALIGSGRMSPSIPPQQPPPGMANTVWAGDPGTASNPQVAAAMASRGAPAAPSIVGPPVAAPNGYMYAPTSSGGFVKVGRANPSLTPAQQYAAAAASAHRPTNIAERMAASSSGGGFDGRGGGGSLV